ncbi:hypothetical protein [Ciceribacter sp. T2.26MG-112.2]|uniref:hypothetical protein n=1 Tax=Ciceribacter sp. T2.26MG-112.2 TaxID=3137154 RepID=UPI0012B68770|nr:hypothetical protein [Ciceribacter naphthalenivorans]
MAKRAERKPSSRSDKTRDVRTAGRFLEELSWLLQSYSHLDFKVLGEANFQTAPPESLRKAASSNGNIQFLVGSLPIIFNNVRYFPSNEDIADFANGALGLNIPRWEKRSRYELIGLIVCETAKLDDQRLGRLVEAITRVTQEDPGIDAIVADRRANSLSWNELIQILTQRGLDEA